MSIKLSVVDQSPVHGSHSRKEAPSLSVELAQLCDQLGYYRYWVAEHHDSLHFANPCPEILVAHIASITKNIKVGSGGVMLSHYSPLKVAETFSMMANLFPGRIDLGIGRAPGGTGLTSSALAFPNAPLQGEYYADQAALLAGFINQSLNNEHPYRNIHILPDSSEKPELWMLGSSGGSAALAGELGYNIALARFIDPDNCRPEIFAAHQNAWHKSGHQHPPSRMLAIACICAETEEQAYLRAGTAVYRKYSAQIGQREDFLKPEEVKDRYRHMSTSHKAMFDKIASGYTIGTPEQCWDEISQLADQFGTEEIATVTVTYGQDERIDSYTKLAQFL